MEHSVSRQGMNARYDVAYAVGAGIVGYSYLVQVGEFLFQSPASYYSQSRRWEVAPGYEGERVLDFDHPILSGCVFCHAGLARLKAGSQNRFERDALTAISCERCHGPVEEHLRSPQKGSIVNPAKLGGASRDSVCEQCHLEGAARVLNPGKQWWDFRVGEAAERTFVTYVRKRERRDIPAVSQSEQLAESRCARESGGKLWCGSCHDPHGSAVAVTGVCLSCHAELFAAKRHAPAKECTSCHMPQLPATNVAHASVTDHRIPRPGGRVAEGAAGKGEIVPWRAGPSAVAERDLGLALYADGWKHRDVDQLQRAYSLLKGKAAAIHGDAEVEAALGALLIGIRAAKSALEVLEVAVKLNPANAELHYLLGSALADTGKLGEAVRELEWSIQLDPSMAEGYRRLGVVYGELGNEAERQRVVERYLKFMPQSTRFRAGDR